MNMRKPLSDAVSKTARQVRPSHALRATAACVIFAGSSMFGGAAFAAEGDLDTSFATGGKLLDTTLSGVPNVPKGTAVVMQSDGKYVIASGSSSGVTVARYLANGALDSSYSGGGGGGYSWIPIPNSSGLSVTSAAIQADGKVVVAGYATFGSNSKDFVVARYTTNGAADTSFNGVGYVVTSISTVTSNGSPDDQAYDVAIQADQKIVVVGFTTNQASQGLTYQVMALVRYNPNGTLDTSFGSGGKLFTQFGGSGGTNKSEAYAVAIQPGDQKIVVAGKNNAGNDSDFALVRYMPSGALDTSFGAAGMVQTPVANCGGSNKCQPEDIAYGLALQPDGKIVAAGYAQNGIRDSSRPNDDTTDTNFAVVRYTAAGLLDSSFGSAGVVTTRVGSTIPAPNNNGDWAMAWTVAVEPGGKILVGGDQADGKNVSATNFAMLRYSSSGALDPSFGSAGKVITAVGTGKDGARDMALQSDGKILLTGYSGTGMAAVRFLGTPPVMTASNPRDLNNDGKTDILFQNNAGQLYVYYMNGAGVINSGGFFYGGSLAPWRIAGTADLNSDGNNDVLFQNSTNGQLYVWYMNGAGVISSGGFYFDGNLGDFKVVGTSDLNNDGKADILFQNAAGQLYAWYMNGHGVIVSGDYYGSAGLGPWRVVGTDDLNGDGHADILLQNSAGQGELYVWYMNGAGVINSGGYFYGGALGDFKVVSTGDLNSDGKADILFQNNAGQLYVWYMNGAGVISSGGYYAGGQALGDWRAFSK